MLILNSHIILNQTELVAQLKYVTLDLVHTQLCRKVDSGACQMKIKFKCFQFGVVYDFPLSDSESQSIAWGATYVTVQQARQAGAEGDAHANCRKQLSFQSQL